MNGLDRIGALAVQVNANLDKVSAKTWNHYGFITEDAWWITRNKTLAFKMWTGSEYITVQEDHSTLNDRQARTVIGYDTLTEISAPRDEATHVIDGVDALDTKNGAALTAITYVSDNKKTITTIGEGDLDISGATVLYVNSDAKTGTKDGSISVADKDKSGKYLANVLVAGISKDEPDLVVVEQTRWFKSDAHKDDLIKADNLIYGANENAGNQGGSEEVGDAKVAISNIKVSRNGTLTATVDLTRAEWMAKDAQATVKYEVYVDGAYDSTGEVVIDADRSTARLQETGYFDVAPSSIEIKVIEVTPAAVNVKYVDDKGTDVTSKLVKDSYTKTLATGNTGAQIKFKVDTTDSTTVLKYTLSGTASDVATATNLTAGSGEQTIPSAATTAKGTCAVVVTITGWETLTETYGVTYGDSVDNGVALSKLNVANGDADDDGKTIAITAGKTTGIAKDEQVKISVKLGAAPTNLFGYKVAVNVNGKAKTFTLTDDTAAEFYTTVTNNVTINKASIVSVTGIEKVGVVADESNKVAVQVAGNTYRIPFNMELDMDKIATANVTNDNGSAATCEAVSFEKGCLVVTLDKPVDDNKTIMIAANKAVSKDNADNKNTGAITLTLSGDEWTLS